MPARKQITRELILSAAFAMLKDGGMEAVHVKALAKKLNCSTQPIYLSFDNMGALRSELSALAINEFMKQIGDYPEEANLYGMAYIRFAEKEKNLFQFLFMRQNAFVELRAALSPIINHSITRLMEQYHIDREQAHHFHDQLWVHAHGIATMIATDFCSWDMRKVENMLLECRKYLSQNYAG